LPVTNYGVRLSGVQALSVDGHRGLGRRAGERIRRGRAKRPTGREGAGRARRGRGVEHGKDPLARVRARRGKQPAPVVMGAPGVGQHLLRRTRDRTGDLRQGLRARTERVQHQLDQHRQPEADPARLARIGQGREELLQAALPVERLEAREHRAVPLGRGLLRPRRHRARCARAVRRGRIEEQRSLPVDHGNQQP
jgi:hypothetical protein